LQTNLFGALRLCQAAIPLMRKNGYGRIVNVSSGRGSFAKLAAGGPSYRLSKTALNALTVILANELKETNILVNAMTPGWVRTRLGGMNAVRSTAEGADTAVWLATLPDDGPRGRFFKDRQELPW
ncbi:MAG: SDR family NAD(P)-dependent oxidoreductase, partial [Thermoanaerobaculia bacterium]